MVGGVLGSFHKSSKLTSGRDKRIFSTGCAGTVETPENPFPGSTQWLTDGR